jgi:hypothetical protein
VQPVPDRFDVFISHAHEDKRVAGPLARALEEEEGLAVWYDDDRLELGDGLRRSIDEGLAQSRFGVLILSPRFFASGWTATELDALAATARRKLVPVRHELSAEELERVSPTLAGRFSVSTEDGLDRVCEAIVGALRPPSREARVLPSVSGLELAKHQGLFTTEATATFRLVLDHTIVYLRKDHFGFGDVSVTVDGRDVLRKPVRSTMVGQTSVNFEIEGVPCSVRIKAYGIAMKVLVKVGDVPVIDL